MIILYRKMSVFLILSFCYSSLLLSAQSGNLKLRIEEEIVLIGDEKSPLFSAYNIYINDKCIFIPDSMGNTVNIYNKKGTHIISLKDKIAFPSDRLNMPYNVVVDHNDDIYINDRGNQRIVVFDKEYNIVKRYLIDRQLESLLLLKNSVIGIGVAPCFSCGKDKYCLLIEINKSTGKKIKAFGLFEKEYITYSWAAASLDDAIYICNKYDKEIFIIGRDRNIDKIINIEYSAVMSEDRIKTNPSNISELVNIKRQLSQNSNTTIGRIAVIDNKLVIQYREREGGTKNTKYLIEMHEINGKRISNKIQVPGEMYVYSDKLYFVNIDNKEKYGKVTIYGYKIS
jgi:hypothetical protein